MNDCGDGRYSRRGLWMAALVAANLLEATGAQAQERRPGGIVFAIGAEETFYRLPMTSYVLDTNTGVFASTQQYSNSISPKASLSYAFEDPAKFGGFGTNARIKASLTRDYASSVATLTTGQLTGNTALINGTIQPGGGFVPATWTSTQTYEEWRARIDLQTDFIVGGNAAVSPRAGVTFSSANTGYNLSRIASGINNGNPYTMINASLYGFYLGAALGVDAKVPLGGGFVISGGAGVDLLLTSMSLSAVQDPAQVSPPRNNYVQSTATNFAWRPAVNAAVGYEWNNVAVSVTGSFAYLDGMPYIALTQAAGQATAIGRASMWGAGVGARISVAF
jgi:hypothetical protein